MMIKKNKNILKENEVLVKGAINMNIEKMKNALVEKNGSTSGNFSEVLQSLEKCGGVGTPSQIAEVMFGTKKPLSTEKKKVRNLFQGKNLKADNPIIKVEKGFVVLTKNVGREKNLYTFCKDEKAVANLLK